MQRLARELNLSETVFALPPRSGGDAWIRIFTPGRELPFAGHPVLGSAFVLAGERDVVNLETGLGTVPVALERDSGGAVAFGRMRQPLPTIEPFEPQAALLQAAWVASSRLPIEGYLNGPHNVYVAARGRCSRGVARSRPRRPCRARRLQRQLLRRRRLELEDADVRTGDRRRARTRRPAPPPGRSRCTWRATARSSSARRSRSPRAPRSGGRRSCTRGSRAQASRSS